MAEERTPLPAPLTWLQRQNDWRLLALLLLLTIPLRGWLLCNTEVTARDSIGYIRYALEFENDHLTWKQILDKNHQHPGYSLAIWAMSLPVRAFLGPADPDNMQLSAQLASNLAAILLVFPMYFLGKFFFDRRTAFWGTLLFQYLPVTGHHLSDGISEAQFILLISLSCLCAVHAMRRRSTSLFTLCGVFVGLAYLTRPEGAMVLAATFLVVFGRQWVPAWRQEWSTTLQGAFALGLASLVVGSLYFGFTNKFTNKPSFLHITNQAKPGSAQAPEPTGAQPLFASVWAATYHKSGSLMERLGTGFAILSLEMLQLFQYVGLGAVGLGMLWHLPRLVRIPEFLLPMGFVAIHGVLILALACSAGYLSDRHLMPIAVWWVYFAAVGIFDLPAKVIGYWPAAATWASAKNWLPAAMSLMLLVGFFGLCLPRTLQRIHGNRTGNHQAGLWLARHLELGDTVIDDHAWSHYYAGLVFEEGKNPELAANRRPTCYVVMTRSHDAEVGTHRFREEGKLQASGGKIVYHWPQQINKNRSRIVVYALPRDSKTQNWKKR